MPGTIHFGGRSASLTPSITQYWLGADSAWLSLQVENQCQVPFENPGVITQLFYNLTTNTLTATTTLHVRINGVNGNNTLSIGSGATGYFIDATHSDSVAATNLISIQSITGAGGTSANCFGVGFMFSNNGGTSCHYATSGSPATFATANTTFFIMFEATCEHSNTANQAVYQTKFKTAGTLKNLYAFSSANARTTTTTITSQLNGSNGGQSVSYGSGATGLVIDTSGSDSISVNSLVNYALKTAAVDGNNITMSFIGSEFISSNNAVPYCQNTTGVTGSSNNVNTNNYLSLQGRYQTSQTEIVQTKSIFSTVYSNMSIYIVTNTITATTNYTFRKNGSNGNQAISIGSGATGYFEDSTNIDSVVGSDLVNTLLSVPNSGTSIAVTLVTVLATIGGDIKAWSGAAFTPKPVKIWNGSAWIKKPLKYWNGSSWIITNY